jgi:hypothetical protein
LTRFTLTSVFIDALNAYPTKGSSDLTEFAYQDNSDFREKYLWYMNFYEVWRSPKMSQDL